MSDHEEEFDENGENDDEVFLDSFEEGQLDPFEPQDIIQAITCKDQKRPDADAKRASLEELLAPVTEVADQVRLVPVLKEVIVDLRVRLEGRSFEANRRAEKATEYQDKLEKAKGEIRTLREKVSECQLAERATEKLRLDNCKLMSDNAALVAAAGAMATELKKALAGLPVGICEPSAPNKGKKRQVSTTASKARSD